MDLVENLHRGEVIPPLGFAGRELHLDTALGSEDFRSLLGTGKRGGPCLAYLGEHCAHAIVVVRVLSKHNDTKLVMLAGGLVDYGVALLVELGGEVESDNRQLFVDYLLGVELVAAHHDGGKQSSFLSGLFEVEVRHDFSPFHNEFYFLNGFFNPV